MIEMTRGGTAYASKGFTGNVTRKELSAPPRPLNCSAARYNRKNHKSQKEARTSIRRIAGFLPNLGCDDESL